MVTQHENDNQTDYAGLSNKELILIYYRMNKELTTMNFNLNKGIVSKQVETPMGIATAISQVSTEHIERFKATDYFKTFNEIVEKLKPIVELIVECDDSLKEIAENFK